MRRKWLILFGVVIGVGALVWVWFWGSVDFRVEGPKEGLLPGTRLVTIVLKKPLSEAVELSEAPFAVEPGVPVVGWQRAGAERVFLLLGQPLQAGQRYTVRALPSSGLSGQVKVQVQPLTLTVAPVAYWGAEGTPALLLQANGELSVDRLSTVIRLRSPEKNAIPFQAVSLSPREALLVLEGRVEKAEVPPVREGSYWVRGAQLSWSDTLPFEVREVVVERQEEGWRIRVRCSHWIEGLPALEKYLRLEGGEPFTLQVRGIDAYVYPVRLPKGVFRLEVLAGFPGAGKALTQSETFQLASPANSPLAWVRPTVHALPVGTPLLFRAGETKEVRMEVWRILPQNVRLFFAQVVERGTGWMTYTKSEEDYGWGYFPWWAQLKDYGELLYDRSVSLDALPKRVERGETWYGMGHDWSPGVYWVKLEGGSRTISTWVVVGEYGLLARRGKRLLTIWAVSHREKAPLSGVVVEVWGPAGQRLGVARTDRNGQATLPLPPDAEPVGVWSQWEGQPSYLPLAGLYPGRWSFETQGTDPEAVPFLVYLQPGRTLFRPGDTLRIAGFLRTPDLRYPAHPTALRLRGELTGPQGKPVWQGTLSCDEKAAWQWQYPLPLAAATGPYRFSLYRSKGGEEEKLAELSLAVEFFRPERLAVDMLARREGPSVRLQVQASYLYGAPAAGLSGEVSAAWQPTAPDDPQSQGYLWTIQVPDSARKAWEREASRTLQLSSEGTAAPLVPLPVGWGYGTLAFSARILDDEGRPNRGVATLACLTQPVLVGLQRLPRYLQAGEPITLSLRALSGEPLRPHTDPLSVRVEVWHRAYMPYVTESWWGYEWHYRPVEKLYLRTRLALEGGKAEWAFTPREAGEYEVRIWAPQQVYPLSQTVEVWGWGGGQLQGDPEGHVEITPQALPVKVGQKARFLIKAPLPGRLLVSVERGQVLHSEWLTVTEQTAELSLSVKEAWFPGAYLHVVAFHSAEGALLPFPISRGMVYIPVEQEGRRLQPVIQAPAQALPGQEIEVTVTGLPPKAQVVLAGVDKGILSLQPQDVGDPYEAFYGRRAYGLSVYEHFPYVPVWGPSIVGGDAGEEAAQSLREAKETILAFLWGPLEADARGRISVKVRLPAFTGQIRWRAYALTENAFGMGEAFTRVSTPVVARVALPFFLSQGDQLEVPLTLQNTTGQVQTGTWEVRLTGKGLRCIPERGTYSLRPGAILREKLRFEATEPMGLVRFVLMAGGRELQAREVRLRPAEAPQRLLTSYTIQPGESLRVELLGTSFLPATREVRLAVSPSPLALQMVGAVRGLIGYPHGCGEQITSRALATLLAGEWVAPLTGLSPDTLRRYTLAAMDKLAALMNEEGALAYWPGGASDEWLSVYGAYFLHEAWRAGYTEAEPLWQKALAHQRARLREGGVSSLPQAFRALLLAQALPSAEARKLFPAPQEVKAIADPLVRTLWWAAFAQVGLPMDTAPLERPPSFASSHHSYGGWLFSPYRDAALLWYAWSFLPAEQRSGRWASLESQLIGELLKAQNLSTQEAAWLLLALRRHLRGQVAGLALQAAGKTYRPQGLLWAMDMTNLAGQEVYAFSAGKSPLSLVVWASGVPVTPQPAQAHGLTLSTRLEDLRTGRPLAFTALQPGQRCKWIIELTYDGAQTLENVALTVPLPAGWQADNPRLDPTSSEETFGLEVVYTDRREDRLLYYLTLSRPKARIEIPVQVVHAGRYRFPSVSAEVMYQPELFGNTASQMLEVGRGL